MIPRCKECGAFMIKKQNKEKEYYECANCRRLVPLFDGDKQKTDDKFI